MLAPTPQILLGLGEEGGEPISPTSSRLQGGSASPRLLAQHTRVAEGRVRGRHVPTLPSSSSGALPPPSKDPRAMGGGGNAPAAVCALPDTRRSRSCGDRA